MRISFDFDGTLAKYSVQQVAKKLIEEGHDVYITTSRFLDVTNYKFKATNDDLYKTAKEVGIKTSHIIFTDRHAKFYFLENFNIHLDDDYEEINHINSETKCRGISVNGGSSWKHKLYKIINKNERDNK